jgi:hypothetical protein
LALKINNILTSVPINKAAAVVVGKGEHYNPNKKVVNVDSDFPLLTKKLPLNAENLIGIKRGQLIVLGMSKDKNGRWVMRCTCGRYTLRTRKAILNEDNQNDCCELCRHWNYVKRTDKYYRNKHE